MGIIDIELQMMEDLKLRTTRLRITAVSNGASKTDCQVKIQHTPHEFYSVVTWMHMAQQITENNYWYNCR